MLITREELQFHPIILDKTYPAKTFEYPGEDSGVVGRVRVQGSAELAGVDIRVKGRLSAEAEAECARCMGPVKLTVEQDFDLIYRPAASIGRNEEIEVPRDELDVGFYSGAGIGLNDIAKEQVILALPMKVLCRPDCRGLCPDCGTDLNHGNCGCPPRRGENQFGALLKNSVRPS